jgi:DNA polymerase III delta subunit
VTIFYGPQGYLRDQGIELIKGAAKDLAENTLRVATGGAEWSAIAAELYTPSFLGGRKLVVLVDEGNFVHNHAKEIRDYAASPSPSALLAAVVPSEKLAGFTDGAGTRLVECRSLRPAELARWIQSEFQRLGKGADRQAAETLARRGGDDLAGLSGHINSLALYVGHRPRVSVDDVERLVVGRPEREIFELALATTKRRAKDALEIAHVLLGSGQAPQQLVWKLAWQYRKLVEAKKLLLAGKRRFEVTSLLQITFYPDEFLALVDAHALHELLSKHGEILAADVALKTSGGHEHAIMETLVLRLAA